MGWNRADGSVTIDTSLNNDNLRKEIDEMNDAVGRAASETTADLKSIESKINDAAEAAKKFKIEPSAEGVQDAIDQLDNLNNKIQIQEKQLANYREEYDRVSRRYGETSDAALKLAKKINDLETAIDRNQKKSDEYADAIADVEEVMGDSSEAADTLKSRVNDVDKGMDAAGKGGISTFKIALGSFISDVVSRAISSLAELSEKTQELRGDMAILELNAADAGVSIDVMQGAARDATAIVDDFDGVLEGVSNLLALDGITDDNLAALIDTLAGVCLTFPETMKFENLAESLQESVKAGQLTGQLSEALTRLGYDVNTVNGTISHMSERRREAYLVSLLQRKGMQEVTQAYRENNKSLIDAKNAQYDYNLAMADLGEVLEPIRTRILSQLTELLQEHKDEIASVVGLLGRICGVIVSVIGWLGKIPTPLLVVIGLVTAAVVILTKLSLTSALAGKGIAAGTKALATAGPSAMQAGKQFAALAVDILVVAAAISLVVFSIAALINAINGVPTKIQTTVSTPNINDLQNQVGRGYAGGTLSASRGWHRVGENGPEYMYFHGGERVLTASQSLAQQAAGGTSSSYTYNDYSQQVFKVDDIETYAAIMRRLRDERRSSRMGYTGR